MIRQINIKDDHPPIDVAIARAIREIECSALQKDDFLKIIHGYGSHGKGGVIKEAIKHYLPELKKKKIILRMML